MHGTPLSDLLPSCGPCIPCPDPTDQLLALANQSCSLELSGAEEPIFSCWAKEHIDIAGVQIELFHLNIEESTRDPLYDEPIERVFQGSYVMKGFVEYPESQPEAGESGLKGVWTATLWIPRASVEEANAPTPAEHDVIRFWNEPFYKKYSVLEQEIDGAGYFFDVTRVDEDGHVFDQPGFVGFKLDLKRDTKYTPERRMAND
jgi:hypothetical protein